MQSDGMDFQQLEERVKKVSSHLSSLKRKNDALGNSVADLQSKMDGQADLFHTYIKNINKQIDDSELAQTVRDLSQRMLTLTQLEEDMKSDRDSRQKQSAETNQKLDHINDTLQTLDQTKELAHDLDTRVNKLRERTEGIQTSMNNLEDAFNHMQNQNENRFTKMQEDYEKQIQRVRKEASAAVEQVRDEYQQQIVRVRDEILSQMQPTVQKVQEIVPQLDEIRKDAASKAHQEAKKVANWAEGALNTIIDRVTVLETKSPEIDANRQKIDAIEDRLNAAPPEALIPRIETLEKNIVQINDFNNDISSSLKKMKDRVDKRASTDFETLQTQVNDLKKVVADDKAVADQRDVQHSSSVQKVNSQTNSRIDAIEQALAQQEKSTESQFAAATKERNQQQHAHGNLVKVVDEQKKQISQAKREQTEFSSTITDEVTQFKNTILKTIDELRLSTESENRSSNSRLDSAEQTVKALKKEISSEKKEIAEMAKASQANISQLIDSIQQDLAVFKGETTRSISDSKTQTDKSLEEMANAISAKMDHYTKKIRNMEAVLKSFRGDDGIDFSVVVGQLGELNQKIDASQQSADVAHADLNNQINALNESIAGKLQSTEAKMTSEIQKGRDDNLVVIDNALAKNKNSATQQISSLELKMQNIEAQMQTAEKASKDLQTNVESQIRTTHHDLSKRIKTVESTAQSTVEHVSKIDKTLDDLQQQIGQANDIISERAKTIKATIDQNLRDMRQSIDEDIKKQSAEIETLRQQVHEHTDSVGNAVAQSDGVKQEIKDLSHNMKQLTQKMEKAVSDTKQSASDQLAASNKDTNARLAQFDSALQLLRGNDNLDLPKLLMSITTLKETINMTREKQEKDLSELESALTAKVADVNKSSEERDTALKTEFDRLSNTSNDELKQSIADLKTAIASTNKQTNASISDLQKSIAVVAGNDNLSIPQLFAELKSLKSKTDSKIRAVSDDMVSRHEQLKSSIDGFDAQLKSINDKNEAAQTKLSLKVTDQVNELQTSIQQHSQTTKSSLAKISAELERITGKEKQTIPAAFEEIEQLRKDMTGEIRSTQTAANECQNKTNVQIQKLKTLVNDLASDKTDANSIASLQSAMETLQAEHAADVDQISQSLKEQHKKTKTDMKSITDSVADLANTVSQFQADTSSRFTTMQGEYVHFTSNAEEQQAQSIRNMDDRLKSTKTKFSSAIESIHISEKEAHDALSQRIDALTAKVESSQVSDTVASKTDLQQYQTKMGDKFSKEANALMLQVTQALTKTQTEMTKANDTQATAIDDIKHEFGDKITALENQITCLPISSISDDLKALKTTTDERLSKQDARIKDAEKRLKSDFHENVQTIHEENTQFKDSILQNQEENKAQHKQLEQQIVTNAAVVDDLKKSLEHKLAKLGTKLIDEIETQVTAADESHTESIAAINASITEIKGDVADLQKSIESTSTKSKADQESRLTRLKERMEHEIDSLKQSISATKDQLLEVTKSKAAENDKRAKELRTDLDSMIAMVNACEQHIDEAVTQLQSQEDDLERRVTKDTKDRAVEMGIIVDRMQKEIDTVRDDVATFTKQVSASVEKSEQARTEDTEELNERLGQLEEWLVKEREKRRKGDEDVEKRLMDAVEEARFIAEHVPKENKQSLDQMREFVEEKARSMKQTVDEAEKRSSDLLTEYSSKIDGVSGQSKDTERRLSSLEAWEKSSTERQETVEGNINELTKEVRETQTQLEEKMAAVDATTKNGLKKTTISLTSLTEKSDILEDALRKFKAEIGDMTKATSKDVASLRKEIDELGRVKEWGTEIAQVYEELDNAIQYVEAMKSALLKGLEQPQFDDEIPQPPDSTANITIKEGEDAGRALRNSLKSNKKVVVTIANQQRVDWLSTVWVGPYQELEVLGAGSDLSTITSGDDRLLVVDALGAVTFQKVRVEASAGVVEVRAARATGGSSIEFDEVRMSSTGCIVSVGGGANASVNLTSCRIRNAGKKSFEVVHDEGMGGVATIKADAVDLIGSNTSWTRASYLAMIK